MEKDDTIGQSGGNQQEERTAVPEQEQQDKTVVQTSEPVTTPRRTPWIPIVLLLSLLVGFVLYVIYVDPETLEHHLPAWRWGILGLVFGVLCALLVWFAVELHKRPENLEISLKPGQLPEVKAKGVFAAFVAALCVWFSPANPATKRVVGPQEQKTVQEIRQRYQERFETVHSQLTDLRNVRERERLELRDVREQLQVHREAVQSTNEIVRELRVERDRLVHNKEQVERDKVEVRQAKDDLDTAVDRASRMAEQYRVETIEHAVGVFGAMRDGLGYATDRRRDADREAEDRASTEAAAVKKASYLGESPATRATNTPADPVKRLRQNVRETESTYVRALSDYSRLEAALQQRYSALEDAELTFQLESAEAAVEEACAAEVRARNRHDRFAPLLPKGVISQEYYGEIRGELEAARARRKQALVKRDMLQKRLSERQANITSDEHALAERKLDLQKAKQEYERALERLQYRTAVDSEYHSARAGFADAKGKARIAIEELGLRLLQDGKTLREVLPRRAQ